MVMAARRHLGRVSWPNGTRQDGEKGYLELVDAIVRRDHPRMVAETIFCLENGDDGHADGEDLGDGDGEIVASRGAHDGEAGVESQGDDDGRHRGKGNRHPDEGRHHRLGVQLGIVPRDWHRGHRKRCGLTVARQRRSGSSWQVQ